MTSSQYSVTLTSTYQQNSPIYVIVNNTNKPLTVYMPSLGQSCRKSYVPIAEGTYHY